MSHRFIFLYLALSTFYTYGQKISTDEGDIKNIKGISDYSVVFEYTSDLEIPNYDSEQNFIDFQVRKREIKKEGTGQLFKKQWFENRETIYHPKFIEQFNAFKLKKRVITVQKKNPDAKHTMVITINFIYPGYDVGFYEEEAKLGVKIKVYENQVPNTILYSTKVFKIHGTTEGDNEYDQVTTAYSELGRWSSKHFCRKT